MIWWKRLHKSVTARQSTRLGLDRPDVLLRWIKNVSNLLGKNHDKLFAGADRHTPMGTPLTKKTCNPFEVSGRNQYHTEA